MPGKVLVTGYEAFGGSPINPSGQAALALDGSWVGGRQIAGRVLPVVYHQAVERITRWIEELEPEMVVMSGQSGRPDIALEQVAVNLSGPGADNLGNRPQEEAVAWGGPAAYFTTLPITAIRRALHEAGIPASFSYSAGTYLCNHVFYGVLHYLGQRPVPAGFIHVPSLPQQRLEVAGASMSQELITRALEVAVEVSLAVPGLPLHRFRDRAEGFFREQDRARLMGRDGPTSCPELVSATEVGWELGRSTGAQAGRLQLLADLVWAQRREPRRQEARSHWQRGDVLAALHCLPPDHLGAFARQGGAELLPVAQRVLTQIRPGQAGPVPAAAGSRLTAPRLPEVLALTQERLGWSEARLWRREGARPGVGLSDPVCWQWSAGAGWESYAANLAQLGQALQLAHAQPGLPWESLRLGDPATRQASGELLAGLLYLPEWWEATLEHRPDAAWLETLAANQWRRAAGLVSTFQRAQLLGREVVSWEQRLPDFVECISAVTGCEVSTHQAVALLMDWQELLVGFRALLFSRGMRAYLVRHWGTRWWQEKGAGRHLQQLWRWGLQPEAWWEAVVAVGGALY